MQKVRDYQAEKERLVQEFLSASLEDENAQTQAASRLSTHMLYGS